MLRSLARVKRDCNTDKTEHVSSMLQSNNKIPLNQFKAKTAKKLRTDRKNTIGILESYQLKWTKYLGISW